MKKNNNRISIKTDSQGISKEGINGRQGCKQQTIFQL